MPDIELNAVYSFGVNKKSQLTSVFAHVVNYLFHYELLVEYLQPPDNNE